MDSEFEQRLRRQPMKEVPADWRTEILSAAREARPIRHSPLVIRHSWVSTLNRQLSTVLWPHPKAWASLAAIWIFIFVLNFSMRAPAPAPVIAEKSAPPSVEAAVELRRQQKLLAELIGSSEARATDRLPWLPSKPRSQHAEIFAA